MKSILQNYNECWVCGNPHTEEHHVFFGNPGRALSTKYGLTVRLCAAHHRNSKVGVHFNKALDNELKQWGQEVFENQYSHEEFMRVFGKNYL